MEGNSKREMLIKRDERDREKRVTYLMPSWMTAFVSKHPNMHCSATRGEISLQHPISRGLLPPRRGARVCASGRLSERASACSRVRMCVSSSVSAHTHLFACVCVFIDTDLLTTLPL